MKFAYKNSNQWEKILLTELKLQRSKIMTEKLGSAFEHVNLHALQALQLTSIYANNLVKCLLVKKTHAKKKILTKHNSAGNKNHKKLQHLEFRRSNESLWVKPRRYCCES